MEVLGIPNRKIDCLVYLLGGKSSHLHVLYLHDGYDVPLKQLVIVFIFIMSTVVGVIRIGMACARIKKEYRYRPVENIQLGAVEDSELIFFGFACISSYILEELVAN